MEPKVKLINYTQNARDLLLFTKFTRLSNNYDTAMDIINSWSEERKNEELQYMLGTIESSWEFVTYVFHISGIDRAFTHQVVRTRGEEKTEVSYAQQSQRTVNMDGFDFTTPKSILNNQDRLNIYLNTMDNINKGYHKLIELGVPPQDARGVLPTAIETSIVCKFDLRVLSHMMNERLNSRAQGLYQDVAYLMREEILKVHPWTEPFLNEYSVKYGIPRFPNYHEDPLKGMQFNPKTGSVFFDDPEYNAKDPIDTRKDKTRPATLEEIKEGWELLRKRGGYEAIPKSQVS